MIYKQYKFGCILFALVNSGMLSEEIFNSLPKKGTNPKELHIKRKIEYELKVMIIWILVSGYYPMESKESFYSVCFKYKKILQNIDKYSEYQLKNIFNRYKFILDKYEKQFSIHDNLSLCDGTWDGGKRLNLKVEAFNIDKLETNDVLCVKLTDELYHWVVFKESKDNKLECFDSYGNSDIKEYSKDSVVKMIKFKHIELPFSLMETLYSLDLDNISISQLKRYEFSKRMQELINRLDNINFSLSEYNNNIKLGKQYLDILNREHYKYE